MTGRSCSHLCGVRRKRFLVLVRSVVLAGVPGQRVACKLFVPNIGGVVDGFSDIGDRWALSRLPFVPRNGVPRSRSRMTVPVSSCL